MIRRHNLRQNRSMALLDSPSDKYDCITGKRKKQPPLQALEANKAAPVPEAEVSAEVHAEEPGGATPQRAEVEVSPSYPPDIPVLPSPPESTQNSDLPMEQGTPPDYAHIDLLSAHHTQQNKNKKMPSQLVDGIELKIHAP